MSNNEYLPQGFWKIEAYTNGYQIVILGDPPNADNPNHDCDEMGCSSVEHVVARVPIMRPMPELEWARIPSRN